MTDTIWIQILSYLLVGGFWVLAKARFLGKTAFFDMVAKSKSNPTPTHFFGTFTSPPSPRGVSFF